MMIFERDTTIVTNRDKGVEKRNVVSMCSYSKVANIATRDSTRSSNGIAWQARQTAISPLLRHTGKKNIGLYQRTVLDNVYVIL